MLTENWITYEAGSGNNETRNSSGVGTFSILSNLWNDADFKAIVRNRYQEIAIRGYCVVRQIMGINSPIALSGELDKYQCRIVSCFDQDSGYFANSNPGNLGFT